MQKVKIESVGYDPKYYPRVNKREDWKTVYRYSEAVNTNKRLADSSAKQTKNFRPFPPVVVVRAKGYPFKFLLIDGLHRTKAFHKAGLEEIWAEIETIPQSKWLARSVELNVPSHRGLDTGDKAWIAQRLKAEGWEIEKVASLLQMKVTSLEKMVVTRCHKLYVNDAKKIPEGRGNRKINGDHYGFVKQPFQGFTDTDKAPEVLRRQAKCPATEVIALLDTFLTLLETDGFDRTDDEVESRMAKIEEIIRG
jgi:hypothetical protein